MIQAAKDLFTSKRVIVAIVGAVADIAVHYGFELPPDAVGHFSEAILVITGMLIGGITLTDAAKAAGKPAGIGHKG